MSIIYYSRDPLPRNAERINIYPTELPQPALAWRLEAGRIADHDCLFNALPMLKIFGVQRGATGFERRGRDQRIVNRKAVAIDHLQASWMNVIVSGITVQARVIDASASCTSPTLMPNMRNAIDAHSLRT